MNNEALNYINNVFTADSSVRGMSLVDTCNHNVKIAKIVELFPNGKMEACWEPEKGYDEQWEVGFKHNKTGNEYVVYARNGVVRVSGPYGTREGMLLCRLIDQLASA